MSCYPVGFGKTQKYNSNKPGQPRVKRLMTELSEKPRAGQLLMECSGACGDLGSFIPHVIGAMTVAGLVLQLSLEVRGCATAALFPVADFGGGLMQASPQ